MLLMSKATVVQCWFVLDTHKTNKTNLISPQIGSRWMVTAAHCLYDNIEKEPLPDDSFSVMLGLHDRSKIFEAARWQNSAKFFG